jgi:hypothetical protein
LVTVGALFVMPVLGLWRAFLTRYVFSIMAKNWAGLDHTSPVHDKFVEQAWLALHYGLTSMLEVYVLRSKPWWPPVISTLANSELTASDADRMHDQENWGLRFIYCLQLGFYSLELITLLTLPKNKRRSDFNVYFFHHVYTVWLLTGSWLSYLHRIGSLVLFLHDVGDIFLPIGKCYSYAEKHIRATHSPMEFEFHKNVGTFFFVLFIIFFAVPRLFFFGGLIYLAIKEHQWMTCCSPTCELPCAMGSVWGTTLVATLGLLYPMHVYWFYLIVKMASRVVFGKYDDVRSEEDDDDGVVVPTVAGALPPKMIKVKR